MEFGDSSLRPETWRRLSEDPHTKCWTGATSIDGSGCAYRYMARLEYGTVLRGLQVHHDCRNRACINPAHLMVLTQSQHACRHRDQDRVKGGWCGPCQEWLPLGHVRHSPPAAIGA